MATTDATLIRRWARDRDPEAFRLLVDRHAGMVFATSRRILGNAADAEDATQECFLELCRLREPASNVAAWLHRVATHRAIDASRARSRRRVAEQRWEAPAASREESGAAEVARLVDEAIESLPEAVREPLVLYYLRGETQERIAAGLGVHQATISHRVRKGVEAVRQRLRSRGLVVAPAVLAAELSRAGSEALPASLRERLGRVAVSGGLAPSAGPLRRGGVRSAGRRGLGSSASRVTAAILAGGLGVGAIVLLLATLQSEAALESELGRDGGLVSDADVPAEIAPEPASASTSVADAETPAPADEAGPVVLFGVARDAGGEPIAGAEVYVAVHRSLEELRLMDRLFEFLDADYYARSRLARARTDESGRYEFRELPAFGEAVVSAFAPGRAGPVESVRLEEGRVAEVDLLLPEGETFAGRLRARGGSPVGDALVSVLAAWSVDAHVFSGAGLVATEPDGSFRLGLGAGTVGCHLRVSSERLGQAFLVEASAGEGGAELTLPEPARLEGTIAWSDGGTVEGLLVRAEGRLPEPPIPVQRLGMRPSLAHEGHVRADGAFVVEGLHPGLRYEVFVVDPELGERHAHTRPLSKRWAQVIQPKSGETARWDHTIERPITIRGRVRTELRGDPVPRARVAVRKDGKPLESVDAEADEDGRFKLHIETGPGEYVLHAEPPTDAVTPEPVADLVAERLGVPLRVESAEEVEADLPLFEPIVLPLRILDHAGVPMASCDARLHVVLPNGGRFEVATEPQLDEGRLVLTIHVPAKELWCEIRERSGAPMVASARHAAESGTELPQETLRLPRTCRVIARVRGADGAPLTRSWLRAHVTYDDGTSQDFSAWTGGGGSIDESGLLRAERCQIELRSSATKEAWSSEWVDARRADVVDLGEVVLSPESP